MLAPFDYLAPGSLAGAVAALAATPGSQPLAGGQLLLPAMKTHRAAPPQLVDLRRIARLHGTHPAPPGQLWIGALTTLDELLADTVLEHRSGGGALVEAARASGDPQFRNRATVGGCLATRRVAPHLAAALLVAEAALVLVGATGERVVSAEAFSAASRPGPAGGRPGLAGGRPGLAGGEILTEVRLPVATTTGSGYEVVADRACGHPVCGVAVAVTRDRHGTLAAVRIAVTGATARPARLRAAERALVGSGTGVDPLRLPVGPTRAYRDDDRASAGYRRHLTRVLIGRAIART